MFSFALIWKTRLHLQLFICCLFFYLTNLLLFFFNFFSLRIRSNTFKYKSLKNYVTKNLEDICDFELFLVSESVCFVISDSVHAQNRHWRNVFMLGLFGFFFCLCVCVLFWLWFFFFSFKFSHFFACVFCML